MKISTPLTAKNISYLNKGDKVLITGYIYVGRDAVHKKFSEIIAAGKNIPVSLEGQIIYYMGPTPAKPGKIIGSAGPTTSSRMDKHTPSLLKLGLKGMIGKGNRSVEVVRSIQKHKAIYFVTISGAGALLSKKIKLCEVIAYPELGPEALMKIYVEDFPAIVAIDSKGGNIYEN
ncbi:MAG: Fe-S-containing hydro-lyase [Candidatus Firestonebacteria bacterium]